MHDWGWQIQTIFAIRQGVCPGGSGCRWCWRWCTGRVLYCAGSYFVLWWLKTPELLPVLELRLGAWVVRPGSLVYRIWHPSIIGSPLAPPRTSSASDVAVRYHRRSVSLQNISAFHPPLAGPRQQTVQSRTMISCVHIGLTYSFVSKGTGTRKKKLTWKRLHIKGSQGESSRRGRTGCKNAKVSQKMGIRTISFGPF